MELVLAVDNAGGIGKDGRIPWPFFDKEHFRRVTAGRTLFMGRRTFESLPDKPLGLDRRLEVVSNRSVMKRDRPDVVGIHGDILSYAKRHHDRVCIGGADLVRQVFSEIRIAKLTLIDEDFDCDTKLSQGVWESLRAGIERAHEISSGRHHGFAWRIVEFTLW